MKEYTKPKQFNGARFIDELKSKGVTVNGFMHEKDGKLFINHDGDDSVVIESLGAHKGEESPNLKSIALSKLAALGLTEEEIAAL